MKSPWQFFWLCMAITDWVQANNIFELFCYLISSSWVLELFVWAVCPDATTTTTVSNNFIHVPGCHMWNKSLEKQLWNLENLPFQYMHTQVNYDYRVILPIALVGGRGAKEHSFQGQEKAGKIWHLLMWACACSFNILGYACSLLIILHCNWALKSLLTELNKPVRSSYY